MRLGQIVLKIRLSQTRFGNFVAGAKEFALAAKDTSIRPGGQLFVIPLADGAAENQFDGGVNQRMTEVFGVIAAIPNDAYQKDQTGLTASDQVHDVRAEIFRALLGWQPPDGDSVISYQGGQLLESNAAWVWWQFAFTYHSQITHETDGVQASDELVLSDGAVSGVKSLPELLKIWAQYLRDDANLAGGMPYETTRILMEQEIER